MEELDCVSIKLLITDENIIGLYKLKNRSYNYDLYYLDYSKANTTQL
jgi:hypothetical protein